MKKTVIGICVGFDYDDNYAFKGYPRMALNQDYVRSIVQTSALPIVIPLVKDYDSALQYMDLIDGLLISGGQDVNPLLYGQEPHPLLQKISVQRDASETLLIRAAITKQKPILGICRGLQIINVYFKGTLYQDNSLKQDCFVKHVQDQNPVVATHSLLIEPHSFLDQISDGKPCHINSFHHQSIDRVGEGLKVVAMAKDGIIEAIEGKNYPVYAVQWHPEMMSRQDEFSQKLFKWFVEKVKNN